mgnify:CR=1 FL=1
MCSSDLVKLAPGGYHIMLLDLKQPLKAGDSVPLSLTVEGADKKRTTVEARGEVRDMAAAKGGMSHDMHKGH